jgi:hypothetical protein
MEDEVNIMGYVYRKADVIESLEASGCRVVLTPCAPDSAIKDAMETLNFSQADTFWSLLLPKSIGQTEPLARITVSNQSNK